MRSNSDQFIAVGLGLLTILGLAYVLYRPRVQQSEEYQATVVPLANIMDVGFILFSPAIVLLVGFRAPFFMLGICLVAIGAGFAIAYNVRHYEPIEGDGGPPDRLERIAEWSLLGASVVNIAYYTMILMALIQLPFDWNSVNGRTCGSQRHQPLPAEHHRARRCRHGHPRTHAGPAERPDRAPGGRRWCSSFSAVRAGFTRSGDGGHPE